MTFSRSERQINFKILDMIAGIPRNSPNPSIGMEQWRDSIMQDKSTAEDKAEGWQTAFLACWQVSQQIHRLQIEQTLKDCDARVALLKMEIEREGQER